MTQPNNLLAITRFILLDDGCWDWASKKHRQGYGEMKLHGKMQRAHRLLYTWFFGPIPRGLHVLHRCDKPSCMRPSHLFLGTHADNMRDAGQKGKLSNRPQCFQKKRV